MIERPYERACRTFAKFVYLSYSPASCCEIAISPTAREVFHQVHRVCLRPAGLNLAKTPSSGQVCTAPAAAWFVYLQVPVWGEISRQRHKLGVPDDLPSH